MTAIHIRQARLTDVETLTACIDAAYKPYAKRIPDLPPVSDNCDVNISQNYVWVATAEDQVIGGLFLIPHDGYMKLANVAVHPDHGGKGVGRALLAYAESETIKRGYKEICLNTHVAMPENVALYTHYGWEEFSREGNTVSMRKELG